MIDFSPHQPTQKWRRARFLRALDVGDVLVVVSPQGQVQQLPEDTAAFARAWLSLASQPQTLEGLYQELCAQVEGEEIPEEIFRSMFSLLRSCGAILPLEEWPKSPVYAPPQLPPRGPLKLLLGLTGAIAAMDAPALVRHLQKARCQVQVVATADALRFVSREGLEALTHRPVLHQLWSQDPGHPVPHIELSQWADVVLVWPASATTLSRIARGDCSQLVSAVAISTRAPVLLAPSMNPAMYEAGPVQRNLEWLREDGFGLVHPSIGVEAADPPERRSPVLGPAPGPEVMVPLLEAFLASQGLLSVADPPERCSPVDGGIDWEQSYQQPASELPWHSPEADADILEALEALSPRTRLLDIGAGIGTLAVAAAERGFQVVAIDVAPSALAQAQAAKAPVIWLRDDICHSDLVGPFELLVDRGCFHALRPEEIPLYIAQISRLCAPRGHLVLKTHHPEEARELGTRKSTAEELQAWFGPAFSLVWVKESQLPGALEPAPRALLSCFQRGG